MGSTEDVVMAIEDGGLVVIPTDTVYGLACRPDSEEAVRELSTLKGRSPGQPIALVAAGVEALVLLVPELPATRVLAGPFTVVLPNPARRLPWLSGARPDTIGVRVPDLVGSAADVLEQVGVVAATSANFHGGRDPRRLADVPEEVLDAVAATLDGGELPGAPSTVVDLTGPEPRVLREGAVSAAEALARVADSHGHAQDP
jgi:L-threonylcarbamoyladenylate synthase